MIFETREEYLQEATALTLDAIIMPTVAAKGYTYDRPRYRVSMGFPKHSRGGKAIAVCHSRAASTDGVNEIFVNPEIDDPMQILETIAHEGIHAVDDCASGHRNFFAAVARGIGLEGPLTATHAGEKLRAQLAEFVELLGPFPHARMRASATHKKGGTRQLKMECVACGFVFRTSAKQIARLDTNRSPCPCCGELELHQVIDGQHVRV